MNTNKHNPGGHERKIVTKLMNAEKNNLNRVVPPVGGSSKNWTFLNPSDNIKAELVWCYPARNKAELVLAANFKRI